MEKILIVDDMEINRSILSNIFEEQFGILEAADETDLKAYEYGAADIIYKPFEPTVVMRRAKNLIELYKQRISIEDQLQERNMQLMESQRKMERNNEFLINALGSLSFYEFEEMKKHTLYGCEILERFKQVDSEFYRYCYDICRWHHEKDDGNGYPDGLKGDDIPIWAHAVAVADCFDALVSERVYKGAYAVDTAFDMIKKGECGQFSDKLMTAFDASKFEIFKMVDNKYSY